MDILEGVNDVSPNLSSLHTSANCTMPAQRNMTGYVYSAGFSFSSYILIFVLSTVASLQCSALNNGNQGCGVSSNKANNYGPAFNAAGGGWYALERTDTFIRIFFWGRNDASVPNVVKEGERRIDTSAWVSLSP